MGQTTANIGIYIPDAGETNYDTSFAAGMQNIDAHDHSGGTNKGVQIASSGLADGSVTKEKLATDVVTAGEGLAIDGGNPNALIADGLLNSLYKVGSNGILVRTAANTATARTIVGGTNVTVVHGDGVNGNPTISVPQAVPSPIPYPGVWLTEDGTDERWYDPRDTFFDHDDFIGGISNSAFPDNLTTKMYYPVSSGTGATVVGNQGDATNPGVVDARTGTTAAGVSNLQSSLAVLQFGGGRHILNFMARLPVLSDGTNTYTVYLGFGDISLNNHNNGAYFVYSHGINSGQWRCTTADAATSTDDDTAIAVDTGWHLFQIDVNAAGTSVDFSIDGSVVSTITTNIPTSNPLGITYKITKSSGTTSRSLYIDFSTYYHKLTTSRT